MNEEKFYENQALLVLLNIRTEEDLSSPDTAELHYLDPDGGTGTWTGSTITNLRVLNHQIPKNILAIAGTWKLTGFVEKGTVSVFTETVEIFVREKFG